MSSAPPAALAAQHAEKVRKENAFTARLEMLETANGNLQTENEKLRFRLNYVHIALSQEMKPHYQVKFQSILQDSLKMSEEIKPTTVVPVINKPSAAPSSVATIKKTKLKRPPKVHGLNMYMKNQTVDVRACGFEGKGVLAECQRRASALTEEERVYWKQEAARENAARGITMAVTEETESETVETDPMADDDKPDNDKDDDDEEPPTTPLPVRPKSKSPKPPPAPRKQKKATKPVPVPEPPSSEDEERLVGSDESLLSGED